MADQPLPVNRKLAFELEGWRDKRSGRFTTATEHAVTDLRDSTQELGDVLTKGLAKRSPRARQHKTGTPRFSESWRASFLGTRTGGTLTVENVDPKAGYVIFPTRAHAVTPKRARFLVFVPTGGGGPVFVRAVRHPGTKGNDVISAVLKDVADPLRHALQAAAGTVTTRITDTWKN